MASQQQCQSIMPTKYDQEKSLSPCWRTGKETHGQLVKTVLSGCLSRNLFIHKTKIQAWRESEGWGWSSFVNRVNATAREDLSSPGLGEKGQMVPGWGLPSPSEARLNSLTERMLTRPLHHLPCPSAFHMAFCYVSTVAPFPGPNVRVSLNILCQLSHPAQPSGFGSTVPLTLRNKIQLGPHYVTKSSTDTMTLAPLPCSHEGMFWCWWHMQKTHLFPMMKAKTTAVIF